MGDRHYKEEDHSADESVEEEEEEASPPYENIELSPQGDGIVLQRQSSYPQQQQHPDSEIPMFLISDNGMTESECESSQGHALGNNYLITNVDDGTQVVTQAPRQGQSQEQKHMTVKFETINDLDLQVQESEMIQFYESGENQSTVTTTAPTAKVKRGKRKAKSKDVDVKTEDVESDFDDDELGLIKLRKKSANPKTKRVRKPDKRIPVPEICHLCGHVSRDRTSMYYHHKYRHEKTRQYQCTLCEKGFCQSVALKLHLRTHTGEKPYACPHPGCDKKFSQKGSLKTHQLIHTGKKNFQCDICQASFSFLSSVSRHKIRAHTEKVKQIFKCEEPGCNKTFRHPRFLQTHKKLVHVLGISPLPPKSDRLKNRQDESNVNSTATAEKASTSNSSNNASTVRSYPCDLCPAIFLQQSLLWQHDRIVHAHFRPYACFKCSRRFAESADAKAHFLSDHGITVFPLETKKAEEPRSSTEMAVDSITPDEENKPDNYVAPNVNDSSKTSGVLKCSIGGTARIETIGNNVYVKRVLGGSKTCKTTYREIFNRVTGQNQPEKISNNNDKGITTVKTERNSNPDPNNQNPVCTGKKLKVLIIRKKNKSGITDPSTSLTRKPIAFSNLLTLANVSSSSKTKMTEGEDEQDVIDTITIDESPPPSPRSKEVTET